MKPAVAAATSAQSLYGICGIYVYPAFYPVPARKPHPA